MVLFPNALPKSKLFNILISEQIAQILTIEVYLFPNDLPKS